jgi:hypothetical protein
VIAQRWFTPRTAAASGPSARQGTVGV